jgi:hypothetical protein
MIPSHMIHPSPLHPSIILWDFGWFQG